MWQYHKVSGSTQASLGDGGKGDGDGGGAQPRCSFSQHHVDFSADHCSFVVQSKRGGDGDGGGGLGD